MIRSPLPLSQAILNADGSARLFLDPAKVTPELPAWLGNGVTLETPEALAGALSDLSGKRVLVDPGQSSAWFFEALQKAGADVVRGADPHRPAPRLQECDRGGGRPPGAHPRWRRPRPLPALGRHRRGAKPPGRDGDRHPAGGLPRSHRRAEGPVVRHHRRRGLERRDRAPTGRPSAWPSIWSAAHCSWSTAAHSTSTAPPTSPARSPSEPRRRRCASASPWCSAATWRLGRGAFPGRHDRFGAGRPWRARRCGRAGLDFDHGTGHGRRLLPSACTRARTDLQAAQQRRPAPRHDRLQRARLLTRKAATASASRTCRW